MNKLQKKWIALALLFVALTAGFLVYREAQARDEVSYRFGNVSRGDVQASVSATGVLGAVTTVNVGTQVSGQVSSLLVDFNDRVKKGQLLARIDPTLAQAAVVDAEANLQKAQAQLLQAQRDYRRNDELLDNGLVARSAYETTESTLSIARASVKSAQVALERAQKNLSYTSIYAPIDGVVVERKVDEGQTVAASLSAPELFTIANDLQQMQILAQVGESDIAQIKEGQPVKFTVQALPNETFTGTVKQVRLQSATQDNVVNYTVVVGVENKQNKLLPGMTARVDFMIKSADDVLTVANSALRFRPSEELQAEAKKNSPAANGQGARQQTAGSTSTAAPRARSGQRSRNGSFGTLYYIDADGKLKLTRVRTGISDSTVTEISGREVKEGMKIILGTNQPASQSASQQQSSSPFGQQQRNAGGPRPGGF